MFEALCLFCVTEGPPPETPIQHNDALLYKHCLAIKQKVDANINKNINGH